MKRPKTLAKRSKSQITYITFQLKIKIREELGFTQSTLPKGYNKHLLICKYIIYLSCIANDKYQILRKVRRFFYCFILKIHFQS